MKYKDENGNWIDIHVKAIDNEPLACTKIYFGTTEPNGYKFANGQELSRTEYAELFKVIGTNYGSGDGSTTFNLPNMNGRVPVGLNVNQEWFNTLGKTGGSTELQEHSHIQTVGGFPSVDGNANGSTEAYGYRITSLDVETSKVNMTLPTGSGNTGNLQPYITVNYIIKVKNLATLPPNAELIDENGTPSDTNTYNANAINELVKDVYSTKEQQIGTWLGKPLYRKTLQFTDTVDSATALAKPHGISNVDTIWIDTSNSFLKSGNSTFPLPQVCYYGSFTDRVGVHVDIENINMYSESGWGSNWLKIVTLNYTKTTDEEV
ncbi:MAG: hypothetical protein E7166_00530 [Firmicutes bacterium]|nr:hypothetical protein [Bacillota bacterium]